jgi:lysozyme family protein
MCGGKPRSTDVAMADFEIAFDETMLFEGGYAHDPDDRGGETYRGIARKFHGDWPGWAILDEIKARSPQGFSDELDRNQDLQSLVKDFYRKTFWTAVGGDRIDDQHVANELFDTGVNQGSATAVKYLQESLNLLNRNQRNTVDIAVDGKFGGQTLAALDEFLELDGGKPDALLKLLNLFQGMRYIESARRDPTQRKFIRGWLKRVGLS